MAQTGGSREGGPPCAGDPLLSGDQYLCTAAEMGGDGTVTNPVIVKGASKDGWNDQETLLLLEALEMYRDDWNKVRESRRESRGPGR